MAVDDTAENLDIIVDLLDEYDVRDVTDAATALKVLGQVPVDLILLDIVMPGIDGFELCRILQSNEATARIPIIFITAMADEDTIEKAYELGGKDYVTKPFRPRELLSRVKTQLDLRQLIAHLQFQAYHDSLTGIYNRRRFFELATTLFAEHDDVHAVMLDVDYFKRLNDRHGHAAGDEVLKQVVGTVARLLPPQSIFGRLGGEEFAIVGVRKDLQGIMDAVEALRQAIQDLSIVRSGQHISCTISAGVSLKDSSTGSVDALLRAADMALYDAKGGGRNKVIVRAGCA
jgi:diguanylate cyclase (GGDEF)-like protein